MKGEVKLASSHPDRSASVGGRAAADVPFRDPIHAWRQLLAEPIGTLVLTFVAAGGDTIEAATQQPVGHAAKIAGAILAAPLLLAMFGKWAI